MRSGVRGARSARYWRRSITVENLDTFLARLFDGANGQGAEAEPGAHTRSPQARLQLGCEILRLILDKKHKWVGLLARVEGYMSVLIDVDEVRAKVRGANHGGLTLEAVETRLSTSDGVVRALINGGHLTAMRVISPVNRCPIVVVPAAEVAKFQQEYVSLFALAKERRKHFRVVKNKLEFDGVQPAFDPKKIGASFYRRCDL